MRWPFTSEENPARRRRQSVGRNEFILKEILKERGNRVAHTDTMLQGEARAKAALADRIFVDAVTEGT